MAVMKSRPTKLFNTFRALKTTIRAMSRPKSPHARARASPVAKSVTARLNRDKVSRVMRTPCSLITGACGFGAASVMWVRLSPGQSDLRRQLLDDGLSVGEARDGLAVHGDGAKRGVGRWPNDNASSGHRAVAGEGDLQVDSITRARHREAQRSVPGRQVAHLEAIVAVQPLGRNTRRDDESVIRLPLERQHAAEREDEFGGDPRVRHVADVPRTARITPRDLRPLVPGQGPSVSQEELRQAEGVLPPSEADERTDDAQLVWRVVAPADLAAPPLRDVRQIFVERSFEGSRGQLPRLVEQRDGVRRRRRIDVSQFHRGRNVVETAVPHGRYDGRKKRLAKGVLEGDEARVLWPIGEGSGHGGGILEAAKGPEVVPIRVDRMSQVAFVA